MVSLSLLERQQAILTLLQQQKRVSVSDVSKRFGVSAVTIRSDLIELDQRGLLTRTHGGAVLLELIIEPEPAFAQRRLARREEKQRIGAAAAALVHDGEAIAVVAKLSARRDEYICTGCNLKVTYPEDIGAAVAAAREAFPAWLIFLQKKALFSHIINQCFWNFN